MGAPIQTLRDDFTDNTVAAAWLASALGSATVAETSGQARFTLPSSVAGTHSARYTSVHTYDLTGDACAVSIGTMVATGVAATAFFQLYLDGNNRLLWTQTSNTIKAQTTIAGVTVDRFSATWNAATYKYLRIREAGGSILWDSSLDGITWTNRGGAVANPFAITDLIVDFGATCGNIASPGSFRLDDVNLILPALTTNWHWTQALWPLVNRYKVVTLALSAPGVAQAYVVTADGVDAAGDPLGNIRYWSGPCDAGRMLTEQPSDATAKAMAVDIPADGRFDLPTQVEARVIRVYHRSISGTGYTLREDYPRRLIQADDIEAEAITALHIAAASITGDRIVAGTITADLITVVNLEAVSAQMGNLHMDGVIDIAATGGIYQGSGTFAAPTTGLKLSNSAGVGRLAGYLAGVEQIAIDTDGRLKAGTGANKVIVDANAVTLVGSAGLTFVRTAFGGTFRGSIGINGIDELEIIADQGFRIRQNPSSLNMLTLSTVGDLTAIRDITANRNLIAIDATLSGGLNVNTTGAGAGAIKTSGSVTIGGQAVVSGAITSQTNDFNATAGVYRVAGVQVLGARKTGWTAATGTATRTSFATGSVLLPALAQAVKAIIDDLIAHGIIGA
jgi:hypothetical protein